MPIFRYPFFYNPYYNRNYQYNFPKVLIENQSNNLHTNKKIVSNYSQANDFDNKKDEKNNSKKVDENSNYFFELFGLKLYFDDILLICLIFFLYQEGVKDDELFISLILLLLS